jgi:mannose-1-phosphate guanylyltransferase
MGASDNSWAIVLAGGEGTRLSRLTTRDGVSTPKQYCSLRGGRSLMADAIARAARIVPRKRVVVIVAEEHRTFWASELKDLPPENLIVQPRNRGTAPGLLLPLLTIQERDPGARVAVIPSDHHVEREEVLEGSMRIALASLDEFQGGLTLLGITPDAPEPGFGWIVPSASEQLLRPIARFVEKPMVEQARILMAQGAVWNSFLLAGEVSDLVRRFERVLPDLTRRMRAALPDRARLRDLYEQLESADFSGQLLQGREADLRLLVVPPCGWTDLGTPARVQACLEALERGDDAFRTAFRPRMRAALDLALALRGACEPSDVIRT